MPEYKLIEMDGKIPDMEAKINNLGKNDWEVLQMILLKQRASTREFVVLLRRAEKEKK